MIRIDDELIADIEAHRDQLTAATGVRPPRADTLRYIMSDVLAEILSRAEEDAPGGPVRKLRERIESLPPIEQPREFGCVLEEMVVMICDALADYESARADKRTGHAAPSRSGDPR